MGNTGALQCPQAHTLITCWYSVISGVIGGKIDLLGNRPNGSLHKSERGATMATVRSLHHDHLIWMRMTFSLVTLMSWLTSCFFATLFPLTPRSRDLFL